MIIFLTCYVCNYMVFIFITQVYLHQALERVQHKVLRLLGVRLSYDYGCPYPWHGFILELESMSVRLLEQDALFLFEIQNDSVQCPEILEQVNIRVPWSGCRCRETLGRSQPLDKIRSLYDYPSDLASW